MKGQSRLHAYRTVDVPLKEVSGVCLRRGPAGGSQLVAIGDRVSRVAWFEQPDDDGAEIHWETADLSRLEGSRLPEHDPQIEAVCADGAGRVLILQESPTRTELIEPSSRRVVASISLEIPGDDELACSWNDPTSSHGEGAVFLRDGHLLIAKEKDPSALVEFGPEGEAPTGLARWSALAPGSAWPVAPGDHRYVALATWWPTKELAGACEDFSDLEIGPDGHLYLLSDKSDSIARLPDLLPPGGSVGPLETWHLGDLDGKPEGLAFTPNGRALVALDTRKARHNLMLFEPPIAAG